MHQQILPDRRRGRQRYQRSWSDNGWQQEYAIIWTDGKPRYAGLGWFFPTGSYSAKGLAINERGAIAVVLDSGCSKCTNEHYRVDGDSITLINDSHRGYAGTPMDINDMGSVVGGVDDYLQGFHAYLFQEGEFRRLGIGQFATAINNAGAIVGFNETVAFSIGQEGVRQWDLCKELDSPAPCIAKPTAINERRVVVGRLDEQTFIYSDPRPRSAFVSQFGRGSRLTDALLDKSWTMIDATDLNDRGQIIGVAERSGQRAAVLLTPKAE